jgi:hypothetical protein
MEGSELGDYGAGINLTNNEIQATEYRKTSSGMLRLFLISRAVSISHTTERTWERSSQLEKL